MTKRRKIKIWWCVPLGSFLFVFLEDVVCQVGIERKRQMVEGNFRLSGDHCSILSKFIQNVRKKIHLYHWSLSFHRSIWMPER